MISRIRIGIFAASSVVPQVELSAGVDRLRGAGFDVIVHPHCDRQHFTFAGSDEQRAAAMIELAWDSKIDVLWAAGGGYGAMRVLPLLERETARHGIPRRKLLVGFSDVTALHHFVRTRWGWPTLHAPMPSGPDFPSLDAATFDAVTDFVRGRPPSQPWGCSPLRWIAPAAESIRGPLVGGNLMVWTTLIGTPWAPSRTLPAGKYILFLEEVGEKVYAVDRLMNHLLLSGELANVRAIVLGDFQNCVDEVKQVLGSPGQARRPLRRQYELHEALPEIFARIARELSIPVAFGLPVGHGPNFRPLPLGALYEISPEGVLRLVEWDWARREEGGLA